MQSALAHVRLCVGVALTTHGGDAKGRVRVLEVVQARERVVVGEGGGVHEVRALGVVEGRFKVSGFHCGGTRCTDARRG